MKLEAMSILQIELPDEELAEIERDAKHLGYPNLSKYLLTLAQMNHDSLLGYTDDNPSPRQRAREETWLLAALNDKRPPIEATPEFWEQLQADVEARVNSKSDEND